MKPTWRRSVRTLDPPSWEISPAQRMWMYEHVSRALCAAAPPGTSGAEAFTSGCDHSHRFTEAWAARAGVEIDPLIARLRARGGLCDCEVALNVAREDDERLSTVLIAGDVGTMIDDLMRPGEPPALERLAATDPAPDDERLVVSGERVLPQRSTILGHLVAAICDAGGSAQLAVIYPDAPDRAEQVSIRDRKVHSRPLYEPPDALAPDAGWAASLVPLLERACPVAGPVAPGQLPLGTGTRLIVHDKTTRFDVVELPADRAAEARQRPLVDAGTLAIAPEFATWLVPFRTRKDLMVEQGDVRRRLARDFFSGDVAIGGDRIFAVCDDHAVAFGLDGTREELGRAVAVIPAPRGDAYALEYLGGLAMVADGRTTVHSGRPIVWSRNGELLAIADRIGGSWQIYVMDRRGAVRRISPPCDAAAHPSFQRDAIVMWIRTAKRRIRVGDKFRPEEDEVLVRCPLDGSPPETLREATGYLRLASPLAHPELPLVAFRELEPRGGGRLFLLDGGTAVTLLNVGARPDAWLG